MIISYSSLSLRSVKALCDTGEAVVVDGIEKYILNQMGSVVTSFQFIVPDFEKLIQIAFFRNIWKDDMNMKLESVRFTIFIEFAR